MSEDTKAICALNDLFRRGDTPVPGEVFITVGVKALLGDDPIKAVRLTQIVQGYDQFTPDNDPYKTHEFGSFDFEGQRCFWKIDIYDRTLKWGAEHPDDPTRSRRVLTIMLAEEY
jgi:hypothetical protein